MRFSFLAVLVALTASISCRAVGKACEQGSDCCSDACAYKSDCSGKVCIDDDSILIEELYWYLAICTNSPSTTSLRGGQLFLQLEVRSTARNTTYWLANFQAQGRQLQHVGILHARGAAVPGTRVAT
ncbi:hypothetical protein EDD22DRAFT_844291 [Suillus occidentalis]|nr:hypothetical protein EDD22DRAFT_844291 [Suillus occidentalis]